MGFKEEVETEIRGTLRQAWIARRASTVPSVKTVMLGGGSATFDAAMLYADLVNSTLLTKEHDPRVVARLIKVYLATCCKVLKQHGAEIRSFDGDRVMGVFKGPARNRSAIRSALEINYFFHNTIRPLVEGKYEILADGTYKMAHCIGVDTSSIFTIRAGIRGDNDLIWVGRAANLAAKLSALRFENFDCFITEDVHASLTQKTLFGGKLPIDIWKKITYPTNIGTFTIFGTRGWIEPPGESKLTLGQP